LTSSSLTTNRLNSTSNCKSNPTCTFLIKYFWQEKILIYEVNFSVFFDCQSYFTSTFMQSQSSSQTLPNQTPISVREFNLPYSYQPSLFRVLL
jgi:hypothetical protein